MGSLQLSRLSDWRVWHHRNYSDCKQVFKNFEVLISCLVLDVKQPICNIFYRLLYSAAILKNKCCVSMYITEIENLSSLYCWKSGFIQSTVLSLYLGLFVHDLMCFSNSLMELYVMRLYTYVTKEILRFFYLFPYIQA